MTDWRKLRVNVLLIGLVVVVVWLWLTRLRTPSYEIVEVGKGVGDANSLDVSTRTLVVIPPKPGVLFSTVRRPGGLEQFAYLILFKYGRNVAGYTTDIKPDLPRALFEPSGRWAEANAVFEVNGIPIEASYRVELNETCTAASNEILTIGGELVDAALGRVFLLDLTADPSVYRQMKVDPPEVPSKLETKEDARRAAEAIRTSLEDQDPEIAQFLQ